MFYIRSCFGNKRKIFLFVTPKGDKVNYVLGVIRLALCNHTKNKLAKLLSEHKSLSRNIYDKNGDICLSGIDKMRFLENRIRKLNKRRSRLIVFPLSTNINDENAWSYKYGIVFDDIPYDTSWYDFEI